MKFLQKVNIDLIQHDKGHRKRDNCNSQECKDAEGKFSIILMTSIISSESHGCFLEFNCLEQYSVIIFL